MDGLISMGIAVVVVLFMVATIAFYFGGVWAKFMADTERKIEEQGGAKKANRVRR